MTPESLISASVQSMLGDCLLVMKKRKGRMMKIIKYQVRRKGNCGPFVNVKENKKSFCFLLQLIFLVTDKTTACVSGRSNIKSNF